MLDPKQDALPFGIHMMIGKNHTTFLADTTINERPTAEQLAHIARETAAVARRMGHEPRVAFLSYSTFGNPSGKWLENIRDAVAILDKEDPGFEYEGEMAPDAALNPKVMALYPFSRLSAPANVLIMPTLDAANIATLLIKVMADALPVGPMLVGAAKPAHILTPSVTARGVVNMTALSVVEAQQNS